MSRQRRFFISCLTRRTNTKSRRGSWSLVVYWRCTKSIARRILLSPRHTSASWPLTRLMRRRLRSSLRLAKWRKLWDLRSMCWVLGMSCSGGTWKDGCNREWIDICVYFAIYYFLWVKDLGGTSREGYCISTVDIMVHLWISYNNMINFDVNSKWEIGKWDKSWNQSGRSDGLCSSRSNCTPDDTFTICLSL